MGLFSKHGPRPLAKESGNVLTCGVHLVCLVSLFQGTSEIFSSHLYAYFLTPIINFFCGFNGE